MIAKIFETSRFVIIGGGAFICYLLFDQQPALLLHYMMLCIVVALSGLTGIEGLFFSGSTAISLGRATGSPYQKQSAMNNLSVAIVGVFVWCANWGVHADATVMMATLCFITLSALVHAMEAIKSNNKSRKNKMRAVWTIALLALCIPIIIQAL
jgi:hypothetical protein